MHLLFTAFLFTIVACDRFSIIEVPKTETRSKCSESPNASSLGFQDGDGLTPSTAFEICNSTQLNLIGNDPNLIDKHYSIVSDIDLSGVSFNMIANSGGDEFSGSIDGNNHTISNLSINQQALLSLLLYVRI